MVPVDSNLKTLQNAKKRLFSLSLSLCASLLCNPLHMCISLFPRVESFYNIHVKISFHGSEKVVWHNLNLRCSFLYAWMDSFGVQGVLSASQRLIFWRHITFSEKQPNGTSVQTATWDPCLPSLGGRDLIDGTYYNGSTRGSRMKKKLRATKFYAFLNELN